MGEGGGVGRGERDPEHTAQLENAIGLWRRQCTRYKVELIW